MRKSIEGVQFIFSYFKRYFISLFFVGFFIILSTWLSVKAPLIMGDAINQMIDYVATTKISESITPIKEKINNGENLTVEDLDALDPNQNMDEQTRTMLTTLPAAVIDANFDSLITFNNIIQKDAEVTGINTVEENSTLSVTAQDAIKKSEELTQDQKDAFLSYDAETLDAQYKIATMLATNQVTIDEKHALFISTIWLLILAYIGTAVTNFIYNILMAQSSAKTAKDMRESLFDRLNTLSIRYFDQSNSGDLLSRFTNDIDNISNALNQTLTQIMSQVALLIGVVIMMFNNDNSEGTIFGIETTNLLTWQMLLFGLVAIILASFIVKKAQQYVSQQQNRLGALNGYIDEQISSQKVIITNGLQDKSVTNFKGYNEDLKETSYKGQVYSGVLMPMMTGIGLINMGTLVFVGAGQVNSGLMDVGLLVAFIQYSQRFFQPLGQIFSQYNIIELAVSGAYRVKEIFNETPEIVDSKDAKVLEAITDKVELRNVTFGYNKDVKVLKNIDITLNYGQKIALVGPTGSGKSTVMNLLNRFYDIDSGEILIDGYAIKDLTLESLRHNVGIVLQESVLFTGTIAQNISYGKPEATIEEIQEAAKNAKIHDFIMELDEGYETQINNNSSIFSVGQKQLMSIARTILTDPDLLILDEATSNVDTVTESKIQIAMENVMKNRTSFVIAHRLKTILDADKIIVLKDGEIIEQGNHDELLELDGFYGELFKNQFVIE